MTSADFPAAQQRVLARQAAREAEARARHLVQLASIQASPLSRLPFPLNQAASPLHSLWTTLAGREGTRPSFRVGQVDAELLDEELLELLKGQVGEAFKYYGPHIRDDFSAEILLALRAALFKFSIWDHDASYGATLQNLRYIDARAKSTRRTKPSKWQKSLYGIITVLGRYGWEKWETWLVDQEGGYTAPSDTVQLFSRISAWASTTHNVAALISFLVFLVNGRYRTLTDRLLRLRLAPSSNQINREVSFEYLNRQLVWHAFTEFLLFLLPLVGISRWRRWLIRAWRRAKSTVKASAQDTDEEAEISKLGPLSFLPERTCAICYQAQNPEGTSETEILGVNTASGGGGVIGSATTDVVNPYETIPCGCVYCFVCLATKLDAEEDDGWFCLRCGEVIKKCQPWAGGVVPEQSKVSRSSSKMVGFVETNTDEAENEMRHLDPMPEEDEEEALAEDSGPWSAIEKADYVASSTNGGSQRDDTT